MGQASKRSSNKFIVVGLLGHHSFLLGWRSILVLTVTLNQIFCSDSQLKNSKHFHTKYKGRSQDFKLGGRINN